MLLRLSIIIPFFNVEQYIANCLDSVYNQDIPEEEYEVICVNDASPDHSRDIVLEYQKKHPNLVLVEHEVNKKLGAARNTGRKIARGKYLWNVDSDDMIASNCLSEILEKCEKSELDVLLFSFKRLRNGILEDRGIEPWVEQDHDCSGLTFWKQQGIQHQAEISQIWTQVYRRAYLDDRKIYSPDINMGEDVPFSYASILFSQRMMACNRLYYIYRVNDQSLTGALKHVPKPQTVYENSFVCGKLLHKVKNSIPSKEREILTSIRSAERYIVMLYAEFAKEMPRLDALELARLCRKGFLRNLFVIQVIGRKNCVAYLKFIFGTIDNKSSDVEKD